MGNLFLLLSATVLLSINSTLGVVVHGSTYRIKNSAGGKYLTSFQHTYLPKSGLLTGKVYEEEWRDQTNQLWDAIVIRPASESFESEFWLFPKKAVLNELTIVSLPQNSTIPSNFRALLAKTQDQMSLNKNFVNLRPIVGGSNNGYLIRSVILDKCFEAQGQHAATFVNCNASKPEQQWEFDIIYDD